MMYAFRVLHMSLWPSDTVKFHRSSDGMWCSTGSSIFTTSRASADRDDSCGSGQL